MLFSKRRVENYRLKKKHSQIMKLLSNALLHIGSQSVSKEKPMGSASYSLTFLFLFLKCILGLRQ